MSHQIECSMRQHAGESSSKKDGDKKNVRKNVNLKDKKSSRKADARKKKRQRNSMMYQTKDGTRDSTGNASPESKKKYDASQLTLGDSVAPVTPQTPQRAVHSETKERVRSHSVPSPMEIRDQREWDDQSNRLNNRENRKIVKSKSMDDGMVEALYQRGSKADKETPREENNPEDGGSHLDDSMMNTNAPSTKQRTSNTAAAVGAAIPRARSLSSPQKPKHACEFTTLGCEYSTKSNTNLQYHQKLCPYGKLKNKLQDMKDEINATHQALLNLHLTTCHKEMEVQNLRKKNMSLESNLLNMVGMIERLMAERTKERNFVKSHLLKRIGVLERGDTSTSSTQRVVSVDKSSCEQLTNEYQDMILSHALNGLSPQK